MIEKIPGKDRELWLNEENGEFIRAIQKFSKDDGAMTNYEVENRETLSDRMDLLRKQLDWLEVDMLRGCKRTKRVERLERFKRPLDDDESVFGLLNSRWNKLRELEKSLCSGDHCNEYYFSSNGANQLAEASQRRLLKLTQEALIVIGKLTSEIVSGLGLSLWLENKDKGDSSLMYEALDLLYAGAVGKFRSGLEIYYHEEIETDFEENCLGRGIEAMHGLIRNADEDSLSEQELQILSYISRENAVKSVCIWQDYIWYLDCILGDFGITDRPDMPQPGLPRAIKPWESDSAKIFAGYQS